MHEHPFGPPLHIDFVITYQDENKTTGYWYIIWIRTADELYVWRKMKNGNWVRLSPIYTIPELHNNPNPNINYKAWANKEERERLDKLLIDHMMKKGYSGYPYVYW